MAKWVCWIYVNTLDTKSIDIDPVSFTQINNTVNRTYPPHICIGNYSIHHDWVVPGSSLI